MEAYYADLAKSDIITLTDTKLDSGTVFNNIFGKPNDSTKVFFKRIETSNIISTIKDNDNLPPFEALTDSIRGFKAVWADSTKNLAVDKINQIRIQKGKPVQDISGIKELTNRIVISLSRDTLDFPKLNSYLQEELLRQNITLNYALIHYNQDDIVGEYNQQILHKLPFQTLSKSSLLPRFQKLKMHFENSAVDVLSRGVTDLVISILFLCVIAGSFLYLYQTIRHQKELAEIKNDLINNITHEFKTPIATVASAFEGIEYFNTDNDPDKTKKYLNISNQQLQKLNDMVEKLLETAILDSERLVLHKEEIDLTCIIAALVEKFQTFNSEKI